MASDFIKEKIKERPVDKRKLAKKIGMTALIAVIFGIVSAVTFSFVYARIRPDTSETLKTVDLSGSAGKDEAGLSSNESIEAETVSENSVSDDSSPSSNAASASDNSTGSDSRPTSTIINNITNKVDISPESYAKLYRELHNVATEAGRALVTVTATTTDTDWFENPYENGNSTTGLIIADNGRQLLILADSSVTEEAEKINVRFTDNSTAEGRILNTDNDTSLQIIGVDLADLSEETRAGISYASLGSSSYASTVGMPVIAIGAPIGITGSEEYGLITSMSQEKELSDFNVHLLTTDIYGSDKSSGVIVDYSGQVIGIITNAFGSGASQNMITTYSISDIKDTIENLANGKERTYMGIIGTSVTQDAVDSYGLPTGAYVLNVDPDSPAMAAGIQSGDVITQIGTEPVKDYKDYTTILSQLSPGVETVVTVQRFSRGDYTELTFEVGLFRK